MDPGVINGSSSILWYNPIQTDRPLHSVVYPNLPNYRVDLNYENWSRNREVRAIPQREVDEPPTVDVHHFSEDQFLNLKSPLVDNSAIETPSLDVEQKAKVKKRKATSSVKPAAPKKVKQAKKIDAKAKKIDAKAKKREMQEKIADRLDRVAFPELDPTNAIEEAASILEEQELKKIKYRLDRALFAKVLKRKRGETSYSELEGKSNVPSCVMISAEKGQKINPKLALKLINYFNIECEEVLRNNLTSKFTKSLSREEQEMVAKIDARLNRAEFAVVLKRKRGANAKGEFAKEIGVSHSVISNAELGKKISNETVLKLISYLDIDLEEVLIKESSPSPMSPFCLLQQMLLNI